MAKDQKAVQGKEGKMLSLWMQDRCWECEDGSPLQLIERGGGGRRQISPTLIGYLYESESDEKLH